MRVRVPSLSPPCFVTRDFKGVVQSKRAFSRAHIHPRNEQVHPQDCPRVQQEFVAERRRLAALAFLHQLSESLRAGSSADSEHWNGTMSFVV